MKLVWAILIILMLACSAFASPFATHLGTNGNTADLSSYNTTLIATTGGDLDLAWIYSSAATTPTIPSISGGGLTWVFVDTIVDTDGTRRISLLRALNPNSTNGIHTIDFGGQTETGCTWSISEFDGVNTVGNNGSAAIVQTAKSSAAISLSLVLNLGGFASISDATAVGYGMANAIGGIPSPDPGYTLLGRQNQNSPALTVASEFRSDNDVLISLGVSLVPIVGISVEIASAVSGRKYGLLIGGSGN